MNAVELLKSQHREVESLFDAIEKAEKASAKAELFEQLANKLAVHAAIEEHQFYPTVKASQTEDLLKESVEEHLAVKRLLADLMAIEADDDSFDAKIKVLKETVAHHVEEEEDELFPEVEKIIDKERLEALGQEMSAEQAELEEQGEPSQAVPGETDHAAPI